MTRCNEIHNLIHVWYFSVAMCAGLLGKCLSLNPHGHLTIGTAAVEAYSIELNCGTKPPHRKTNMAVIMCINSYIICICMCVSSSWRGVCSTLVSVGS